MTLRIQSNLIRRIIHFLRTRSVQFTIRRLRKRTIRERYQDYQKKYIQFDVKTGDEVLDIGSGNDPFPFATILADRYIEPTYHRSTQFKRDGKPTVISDVAQLPFGDKQFDYVYCAHLLEHVDDPLKACQEIMRVGRRGYIETPTLAKDMLFAWAKRFHKWHLISIGNNLCFFEYSERQLEGIRISYWRDEVSSKWYSPLQDIFHDNLDIFNIMFTWDTHFNVYVFLLDGTVKTLCPAEAKGQVS